MVGRCTMTTTTALRSSTPTRASALAQTPRSIGDPENSLTGFKRRITRYAFDNGIALGDSKISRLATKIKKRADRLQEVFDFEAELRNLGITSDTTPRDAEHNLTCTKSECDKCGRTQWK